MTKRELIETMANKTGVSKRQAESFINTLAETVIDTVAGGEKVSVTGFGVFDLGQRAARRGVDPRTQEEIQIPAMNMPRFRAGKRFKEAVRS